MSTTRTRSTRSTTDKEDDSLLKSQTDDNQIYQTINSNHLNEPKSTPFNKSYFRTVGKSFWRRLPKTKPILYLLVLNLLQSYGFYIVSDYLRSELDQQSLEQSQQKYKNTAILVNCIKIGLPALFFPIGGILGDVYFGRYLMSLISLFISWIMYILLTLSSIISYYNTNTLAFDILIPVILLVVIGISDGIFEINWLTFGADQLINAPTDEVSSFIYNWYWCKNFSSVLAILTKTALYYFLSNYENVNQIATLLAVTVLSIALLMEQEVKKNFDVVNHKNSNPIKHICGVLFNAATSRPNHPFISAFRYGEDPPSGLEFAREYHGGKYSDENVEDVRSCGRVSLIILLLSGFSVTYAAFSDLNGYQIQSYGSKSIHMYKQYILTQFSFFAINCVVIVFLPIWNNIAFPLLRHYVPNTRKRIGIGMGFSILACIASAAISYYINYVSPKVLTGQNFCWLLLPTVIIGIAETAVYIPILEFIYAQSPDNMKGLLIGCHYFLIGLWSAIAALAFNFIHFTHDAAMWYYTMLALISCAGLILFSIFSCCYKNRRRNNPISDILRISMYY